MKNELMLKKNLSALSVRYPQLALQIKKLSPSGNFKLVNTPAGEANLFVKHESSFMSFYNPEYPTRGTQKYMDSLEMKFAPVVVFLGLGLGYHLDYFMRNLSKKLNTRKIIIYEKDIEILYLALTNGDYTNIINHPDIYFFIGNDAETSQIPLRMKILLDEVYDLRSVKIIPLPTSIKIHPDYYTNAVNTVKKSARQVMVLVGNDSFDSLVAVENMMLNLTDIISNPGINECVNKFKGKPGILVSSGPSLKKNMHLLKGIRDNALIFACDSSLMPLMKRDIRPHFTTSIERTPGIDEYYKPLNDLQGVYFLAMAVLMPETIKSFKGRKFIGYRNYSHYKWLENDKGQIICGMSVANLVFSVLKYLGCDPIILIGQDLSYADTGETHVPGKIYGESDPFITIEKEIEMEGNYGNKVKSIRGWETMKIVFEEDVASYQGTCINATEGGAKIKGTKVMSLQEAIDQHCKTPFYPQTIIDKIYDDFQGKVNVQSEIQRINNKCSYTNDLLENIIEEFDRVINDARRTEKDIIKPFLQGKDVSDSDFERLLSIEKKWLELSQLIYSRKDIYEINLQTIQNYDVWLATELSFLKDIYTDKKTLSMARVLKMTEWFSVIGSLLIFTRNILKQAKKTTEAYKDEMSDLCIAVPTAAANPQG